MRHTNTNTQITTVHLTIREEKRRMDDSDSDTLKIPKDTCVPKPNNNLITTFSLLKSRYPVARSHAHDYDGVHDTAHHRPPCPQG